MTQETKCFNHQNVEKDFTKNVAQFVNVNNVPPQEWANDHETEIYVPKRSQHAQDVEEPNPGDQLCDLVKSGEPVTENVAHSVDCIQNEINSHVLDKDEIGKCISKSLFVANCDKTEIENLSSDQVIEVGVNFNENCRDNMDLICNENDKTFHDAQTDTFQKSTVGSQEQIFAKGTFKLQENALLDDEEHGHEDMIGRIATDQTLNTDSLIKLEDAVIYEVMNGGYENKNETIVFEEPIKIVANLGCGNSSENDIIDTRIVVDAVKQDANLENDFSVKTNGNENIIISAVVVDEEVEKDLNLGCENNESHDMKDVTAVSKARNTNTAFGSDCDIMKDMKNTVDFDIVKDSLNLGFEEINNDNLTDAGEKGLKDLILGCEDFVIDAIPIDEAANRNVISGCKDGMIPTAFVS